MARSLLTLLLIAHVGGLGGCDNGRPGPGTKAPPATGAVALFPRDSLDGWRISHWADLKTPQQVAGEAWKVEQGVLYGLGKRTWIFSEAEYGDFVLTFDVKITRGANGGVGLRFPPEGDPAYKAMEIQVVDHEVYYRGQSRPEQRTGSIYDEIAATKDASSPVGQWSTWQITARGSHVTVTINAQKVLDADLSGETKARQQKGPPLAQRPLKGRIGFQNLNGLITLRNLKVQKL
jgi:hypothetical protein